MVRPLWSIREYDQAIAADGTFIFDLPVNPVSVINIVLRPLNDTGTLANVNRPLALVDAALESVRVSRRGSTFVDMSGGDLMCLNYLRHGIMPREANDNDTNNERRAIVVPIIMGRNPFDPSSCMPASRRGEASIEMRLDIADTGYDGLRLSIETLELIDAKPSEYERKITTARTFAATGPQDVQLPLGNKVRGMMLYGTTGFVGATPAPSWGRISVLLDNEERWVHASDWEVALTWNSLMGRQPPQLDAHIHKVTTDGNAQTALASTPPLNQGWGGWQQRLFMDFDPWRNDSFSIDTSGGREFKVHAEAETADAVRVITIEQLTDTD